MFIVSGKAKQEVLASKPWIHKYDSVAGGEESYMFVTAILTDNTEIELDYSGSVEFAGPEPNSRWDCDTVQEQIAKLGEVKGLKIKAEKNCSWMDFDDFGIEQRDFRDGLPRLCNGQSYEAYCPLEPINWTRVRRRLEDRIRKDESAMRQCVATLGIKLW